MNKSTRDILIIASLGILLFIPFLGKVSLFDWDEVNFAEAAREMIVTGDYLNVKINFAPFWEKPPLFIWIQVISMKIFGISEFAARFPNALCGIFTLIVLYLMGNRIAGRQLGLIWSMIYGGSILSFFYFKSGIIDPWFNLFIFSGVFFAVLYFNSLINRTKYIFISGFLIGLAVFTKGPVALLVFGITGIIYFLIIRFKLRLKILHVFAFLFALAFSGGAWFFMLYLTGNKDVIVDFFNYQIRLFSTEDAGQAGFPGYHFVVVFLGMFPASVFFFAGMKRKSDENPLQKDYRRASLILLSVVLILFSIVKTKIVHYSSLAWFPLSFISAIAIMYYIQSTRKTEMLFRILIISIVVILSLFLIAITWIGKNGDEIALSGIIKDKFITGCLTSNAGWTGWEPAVLIPLITGTLLFFIYRNKLKKVIVLFSASALFCFLMMFVYAPRIEEHVQIDVVNFYKSKSSEDCYAQAGFKGYAHLFYGQRRASDNPLSRTRTWLENDSIDKPAWFAYKINRLESFKQNHPDMDIMDTAGGYFFARRLPQK